MHPPTINVLLTPLTAQTGTRPSYIGMTFWNLNIRLTEHKEATKKQEKTNHIAKHH